MHTCQDVEPLLTAYADGEGTATARPVVEEHLAACPACRERVAAEREVRSLLHARRPALLAVQTPAGLRERCARAAPVPAGPASVSRYWAPLSMAASILLLVAAGVFFALRSVDTTALAAELTQDHQQCFRMAPAGPAAATTLEERWRSQHGWALEVPEGSVSEALILLDVRNCLHSDGDSAHILYRSHGEPVSLFVRPASRPAAPSAALDGHAVRSWTTDAHQYTLVTERDAGGVDELITYLQERVE